MNLALYGSRKKTIVSFEENTVKVVCVSGSQSRLTVDKVYTFTNDEFDDYLARTKETDFVVVYTFQQFYQDTFSLRPAKPKYLTLLAKAEIKKNSMSNTDFLFFHHVLEDVQQEGKKTKETFVFSVDYDTVSEIIDRFDKHGKTIMALYPSVLTLTSLVAPMETFKGHVVLSALDTGLSKILFLIGDGALRFVRFIQSGGPGLNDADVDNINMTISYFRQTLRISPTKLVLLNFNDGTTVSSSRITVPKAEIDEIPKFTAPRHIIAEYIVPLSAALEPKRLSGGNLLPSAHKTLPTQKLILTSACALLVLVSLGCLVNMAVSVKESSSRKEAIARMTREIYDKEPLFRQFDTINNQLQKNGSLVAYMNKANSSPDWVKILTSFNFLPMDNITIEHMEMDTKDGAPAVRLKGAIQASNFSHMDSTYRSLMEKVRKITNLEIISAEIDPKEMIFTIEAKWKI
jgi:hypothetical protein